ncbi:hypothetical protein Mnod_2546 [Methylobacterium nodulans ORS 2060]|uniref:Uncharacterized protein n=1 Tax=Methylobacterium nodulans (strain LMG 21967 / CNCM I-2342 / ORS 2060) TaxID=460265 RepID=B8ICV1_METNO|nr:hypothetical protein Mnod_2546 [Methylobacterium nodulans ORS 2060]
MIFPTETEFASFAKEYNLVYSARFVTFDTENTSGGIIRSSTTCEYIETAFIRNFFLIGIKRADAFIDGMNEYEWKMYSGKVLN